MLTLAALRSGENGFRAALSEGCSWLQRLTKQLCRPGLPTPALKGRRSLLRWMPCLGVKVAGYCAAGTAVALSLALWLSRPAPLLGNCPTPIS